MELNTISKFPDVILTSGNRPTLPQCGKEGVVLYGWHFLTLNVNDNNDVDVVDILSPTVHDTLALRSPF